MDPAVIEKIRKLLALAERGGTPEEAATAAAMAANIALKHNLDLRKIQEDAHKANERPGIKGFDVYQSDKYEIWINNIVHAVCEMNACSTFFEPRPSSVHYIVVGRPTVIPVVKLTIEYLVAATLRLNTVAVKKYGLTQDERRQFRKAFRITCSATILRRMRALLEEMRTKDDVAATATGSTALVVADYFEEEKKEVALWIEENITLKTRDSRVHNLDGRGAEEGRKAGESVALNQQVTADQPAKDLKRLK